MVPRQRGRAVMDRGAAVPARCCPPDVRVPGGPGRGGFHMRGMPPMALNRFAGTYAARPASLCLGGLYEKARSRLHTKDSVSAKRE